MSSAISSNNAILSNSTIKSQEACLEANREFALKAAPSLLNFINLYSQRSFWCEVASNPGLSKSSISMLIDNKSILADSESILRSSFYSQLNKPRKLGSARVQVADPKSLIGFPEAIIDKHGPKILDFATNLQEGMGSDTLNPPINLIACGSLYLPFILEWVKSNIDGSRKVLSITVVEPNPVYLAAVLKQFSLESLSTFCKNNGVGLHLLADDSPHILSELLFSHLTFTCPFIAYNAEVLFSPIVTPEITQISDFLLTEKNFGQRFLASLGESGDEFNQVVDCFVNSTKNRRMLVGPIHDRKTKLPCFIVGSGPSLEYTTDLIAKYSNHSIVVACGSSISHLLQNDIKVDILVLLERGGNLFADVKSLVAEGYDLSGTTLVSSMTCDPRLDQYFRLCLYYHRPQSAASSCFPNESQACLPIAGPESVNAAVDAVIKMGFNNLFLVGVDLGSPSRTQTRIKSALGSSDRDLTIPIRSNLGRTIFTAPSLIMASYALDASLCLAKSAKVVRIGEGIILESAETVSLDEACKLLDSICNFNSYSSVTSSDIDSCAIPVSLKTHEIIESISNLSDSMVNLLHSLEVALRSCDSWSIDCTRSLSSLLNTIDTSKGNCDMAAARIYRFLLYYTLMPLYDSCSDPLAFKSRKNSFFTSTCDINMQLIMMLGRLRELVANSSLVYTEDLWRKALLGA